MVDKLTDVDISDRGEDITDLAALRDAQFDSRMLQRVSTTA